MTDRPGGEFSCSGASISVENVSKRFGTVKALDRVDMKVEPGIVFALLGPNGSRKDNAGASPDHSSSTGFWHGFDRRLRRGQAARQSAGIDRAGGAVPCRG